MLRDNEKDRKEWSALVHMQLIEFNAAIFACPCVVLDRPGVGLDAVT